MRHIAASLPLVLLAACAGPQNSSAPASAPSPSASESANAVVEIEVVATFSDTRPGNIAVTTEGRVFTTQHPLDDPTFRLVEILPDGTKQPYPSEAWSGAPADGVGIASTIGIGADSEGHLWVLDMGSADSPAQLLAFDTETEALDGRWELPADVLVATSFVQDFALDEERGQVYMADMT